jgi:D-beta-D-heptose 7-phosphate kinase/D-beta-D-heptose 1-phosphate adenosyltransferase
MDELGDYLDRFRGLRVLALGEAMLDRHLCGTSGRLCQDVPVRVVTVACRDEPGGAANTAANARALGAEVACLSVIGDDPEGDALRRLLERQGVDDSGLIAQPGRTTLARSRVTASGRILVRYNQGDTTPCLPAEEDRLIQRLAALWRPCDAVIVSDYDYGVVTPKLLATLVELQRRRRRVLVVDSCRLAVYRAVRPTAVKPNYAELLQLLEESDRPGRGERAGQVSRWAGRVLRLTGAQVVAVTLDKDGAVILERARPPYRISARPRRQVQAAGAGDAYVSALALALAARSDPRAAAELAGAAAAVIVDKQRSGRCTARELARRVSWHAAWPAAGRSSTRPPWPSAWPPAADGAPRS